jgi:ABC-type nickel/cobalt efflux system permease component RcnA
MTAQTIPSTTTAPTPLWQKAAVALAAVALVALVAAVLSWWLAPSVAPPARSPFGMGLREPTPGGALGAYILSVQSSFYGSLRAALGGLKDGSGAYGTLLLVGLAYGVFHAAGPGHGKAVISGYIVADEKALRKGVALSFAAALVQAISAIAIVLIVSVAFRATASVMNKVANNVELASFAFVALLGATVTWRKAGKLLGTAALARNPQAQVADGSCDHVHLPGPEVLDRLTSLRDMAGVALAAGIRPCAGALIILVFALSQGHLGAGIAATFAMALGTAITTSAIAALAVFAKAVALRFAGGRGASAALALAALELLAAAFVFVLGISLLLGLWSLGFGG